MLIDVPAYAREFTGLLVAGFAGVSLNGTRFHPGDDRLTTDGERWTLRVPEGFPVGQTSTITVHAEAVASQATPLATTITVSAPAPDPHEAPAPAEPSAFWPRFRDGLVDFEEDYGGRLESAGVTVGPFAMDDVMEALAAARATEQALRKMLTGYVGLMNGEDQAGEAFTYALQEGAEALGSSVELTEDGWAFTTPLAYRFDRDPAKYDEECAAWERRMDAREA